MSNTVPSSVVVVGDTTATTDPNSNTFTIKPEELQFLIDPYRNPEKLKQLGGASGVLKALRVHPAIGIITTKTLPSELQEAVRDGGDGGGGGGGGGGGPDKRRLSRVGSGDGDHYGSIEDLEAPNGGFALSSGDDREQRRHVFGINRLPEPPHKSLWHCKFKLHTRQNLFNMMIHLWCITNQCISIIKFNAINQLSSKPCPTVFSYCLR
jgi:hypothetical protein